MSRSLILRGRTHLLIALLISAVGLALTCLSATSQARTWALRFDQLHAPTALTVTEEGEVIVADSGHIYQLSLDGTLVPIAGTGERGYKNGPAREAQFKSIRGLALTSQGALIIADSDSHAIRMLSKDRSTVTTIAGLAESHKSEPDFKDGPANEARFYRPMGLAIDLSGAVIVADSGNHLIRRLDLETRQVTTIAGRLLNQPNQPQSSAFGFRNDVWEKAMFNTPTDVAVAANGDVFVADSFNNQIRKLTSSDGKVTMFSMPWGVSSVKVLHAPDTHRPDPTKDKQMVIANSSSPSHHQNVFRISDYRNTNSPAASVAGELMKFGERPVTAIATEPSGGFWFASAGYLSYVAPDDELETRLTELKASASKTNNVEARRQLELLADRRNMIRQLRTQPDSRLLEFPLDLVRELNKMEHSTTPRARWALMAAQ